MKKIICFIAAIALLTACDPVKDDKSFPTSVTSPSDIEKALTLKQYSDETHQTEASDGNYFTFSTSPTTIISIYVINADGSEKVLANGTSGSFAYSPARGSDPNQTLYVRTLNSDRSYSIYEKAVTVYVPTEMPMYMKLLVSDSGTKTWKWDPTVEGANGVVWGNMGYCGGSGADVGTAGAGQWWGVVAESETEAGTGNGFLQQLQHTHDGAYHGDGDVDNSYMVFTEDGVATTYDANGDVIRTGPFEVANYDENGEWKIGDLVTTAILWPYEINSGGRIPGTYEICYLSIDKMTLVYPDNGDYAGLGNWGEATFWHFCSNSDVAGLAAGFDNGKDWTWDYDGENTVWGNMGYCGGSGSAVGLNHEGQWWGVVAESETEAGTGNGFMQQLQHTEDGAAHGDESMDAFMTLTPDGMITRHAGDGSVIKSGSYELKLYSGNEWKVADLNTTAGTILFPYEINSGGKMPTTFEVCYISGSKMCLVYPDNGAFGDLGNWGEATYWHFKAK